MPRGRKKLNKSIEMDIDKPNPKDVLHNLLAKARELTDKDIWDHKINENKKTKHKQRLTEKQEDLELMHETELQTNYVHLTKQPTLIKNGIMRDYQINGLNWMINLRNENLNGILADEMGLGKTLQIISLIAYLNEFEGINGIHLIIVPKSTLTNWRNEFNKWYPSSKVFILDAPNKVERQQLINNKLKPCIKSNKYNFDVILCSYEISMIEKSILHKIKYRYIIIDEAHRLKNDESKFSKVLKTFNTEYKLLLTGTPLQNNLKELWCLLNYLLPNLFDNSYEFECLFDFDNDEQHQMQIFDQLNFLLKPFLLRRLKVNVTKSLPKKHESILFVYVIYIIYCLYILHALLQ